MKKTMWAYAATATTMIALDVVWLTVVAKPMYQHGIGHLMAITPRLIPAALFYLLFPLGLVLFAVAPRSPTGGWSAVMAWGALLGFFAYATYDLTNLATLKNWPIGHSLIDMAWGTAVSGVASTAGYFAFQWASRP